MEEMVIVEQRLGECENSVHWRPKGYRLCLQFIREDKSSEWTTYPYQDQDCWFVEEFKKVNIYLSGALPVLNIGTVDRTMYMKPMQRCFQFLQSVDLSNVDRFHLLATDLWLDKYLEYECKWEGNFVLPVEILGTSESSSEEDCQSPTCSQSGWNLPELSQ